MAKDFNQAEWVNKTLKEIEAKATSLNIHLEGEALNQLKTSLGEIAETDLAKNSKMQGRIVNNIVSKVDGYHDLVGQAEKLAGLGEQALPEIKATTKWTNMILHGVDTEAAINAGIAEDTKTLGEALKEKGAVKNLSEGMKTNKLNIRRATAAFGGVMMVDGARRVMTKDKDGNSRVLTGALEVAAGAGVTVAAGLAAVRGHAI